MYKEYNRQKAVDYAIKYALNYNKAYFKFNGIGGDCTNFVSQCLYAGSNVMNYDLPLGWFYINSYNRTASWTGVTYLKNFLVNNKKRGVFATERPIEQLQIGDIIQLKQHDIFNHTLIISKIENGDIYVCAHSVDSLNRPLSTYDYVEIVGLHIEGVY